LVIVQNELHDEIATAGGMLKVGKFSRKADVDSYQAAYREFEENIVKYSLLKDVFSFREQVFDIIEAFIQEAKARGLKAACFVEDEKVRRPKLHLKTNFMASKELQEFLSWQDWENFFVQYGRYQRINNRYGSDHYPLLGEVQIGNSPNPKR
jgi:hypothetical protein